MMLNKNEEEKIVLGIDNAVNPKQAEEDFVAGLLEAAAYKDEEENKREIEIVRGGKRLFSFTVRPISSDEFYAARKKGSKFIKNPVNKRLPMIESEKDFNTTLFHSWIIYTATVDEDKEKVWNNPRIKEKYSLMMPTDSVPVLLKIGEINMVVDTIMEISGIGNEDEESAEDTIKN